MEEIDMKQNNIALMELILEFEYQIDPLIENLYEEHWRFRDTNSVDVQSLVDTIDVASRFEELKCLASSVSDVNGLVTLITEVQYLIDKHPKLFSGQSEQGNWPLLLSKVTTNQVDQLNQQLIKRVQSRVIEDLQSFSQEIRYYSSTKVEEDLAIQVELLINLAHAAETLDQINFIGNQSWSLKAKWIHLGEELQKQKNKN